ncbi:hypothetical protein NMG60_11004186 [Bertholletia excelsa]
MEHVVVVAARQAKKSGERNYYFFIHDEKDYFGRKREAIQLVGEGIGSWRLEEEAHICDSEGEVLAFKFCFNYYNGSILEANATRWSLEEYHLSPKSVASVKKSGLNSRYYWEDSFLDNRYCN